MKLLFLLGDYAANSLERKLAGEAEKLIAKDAEVLICDPPRPLSGPAPDGVWIFTHEENGGCPEALMSFLEENFAALEDVPAAVSGVGGKAGGMNAVYEILEFFKEHGGRPFEDVEPLCIPVHTSRFDPEPEEKLDLFFYVDGFLKYCGMDKSESRKIAFGTVVNDYFKLMKRLAPEGPRPTELTICGDVVKTDAGTFDGSAPDASPEIAALRYEIETLVSDYEIEEAEIASALLEKILREW